MCVCVCVGGGGGGTGLIHEGSYNVVLASKPKIEKLSYALIGTFCGKSLEILFPMVSGHCSVANRLILTLQRSLK